MEFLPSFLPSYYSINMASERIDDITREVIEEGGFRIQGTYFLLTYKTHVDKNAYKLWLEGVWPVQEVIIAHEKGDEEVPYEHSHVYIKWQKKIDIKGTRDVCRRFDYEGIHPNIKNITNWRQVDRVKNYLAKEDPENAQYRSSKFYLKIREAESVAEVLRGCERPSDVLGSITAYKALAEEEDLSAWRLSELKPWQAELDAILDEPADDRSIVWYCDRVGGAGKTAFCKHYVAKRPDEVQYFTSFNGINNVAQAIISHKERTGRLPKVLFLNLTREQEELKIYGPLEAMKDGILSTTKYSGGELRFGQSPHIVVMANWMPRLEAMSMDRWRIKELS